MLFLPFSLTYLSRWTPNARCLVADDAFTSGPVCAAEYIVDDAVDQWRKRLRCFVETSGRHFKHLL